MGKIRIADIQEFIRKILSSPIKTIICLITHRVDELWAVQRAFSAFLLLTPFEVSESIVTVLPYKTVHFQGHRYDNDTYRFYALAQGAYDVKASFGWQIKFGYEVTIKNARLMVYRNGIYYKTLDYVGVANYGTAPYGWYLSGSCLVYMECGDYIDIRITHIGSNDDLRDTNCQWYYGYFDVHYAGNNVQPTTQPIPSFNIITS